MKLTREQVNKWNENNQNGFAFDIQYFAFHHEKTITKKIEIGNDNFIVCQIMFNDEIIQYKNEYGCQYGKYTGKVIPIMHLAHSKREGSMLVSHGLGYWHTLGEPMDKKNYSVLQSFTKTLDDSTCIAIFDNLKATKVNMYA